jgi:predicted glycogen debranching enzyme
MTHPNTTIRSRKNSPASSQKPVETLMEFPFNQEQLHDLPFASEKEWIETNGLGGFAGSTIINLHTRRYHGLLVAAVTPPTERIVLLSKLEETIYISGEKYELGCNDYGGVIHPQGHLLQQSFTRKYFPQFIYSAGGVTLKKTIAMKHGENTTLIVYEVLEAKNRFELELLPLIAGRDYHSLTHASDGIRRDADFSDHVLKVRPYQSGPELFISVPGSEFLKQGDWYYHFNYSEEKYRGLEFEEDLFSHGKFNATLKQGDKLGIIISTENPSGRDAIRLLNEEKERRQKLLFGVPANELIQTLALAADQFIVRRDDDLKTIIAGYHWFTDWGRDTMISLPGLCLSTGKHDDAKKILQAFSQSVSEGMLPNRFLEKDAQAEYNNVDGTLWFFIAAYRYFLATGDKKFVLTEILPVMKEIIRWHEQGTRYHIHEDADGLLFAGEPGVQLTWMDAKVGDWVVTPRIGKPVEVNALWYNALRIFTALLSEQGETALAEKYTTKAERILHQFLSVFTDSDSGTLFDVVNGEEKDRSLRPNQLFATGLPFALVTGDQATKLIAVVREKLLTPLGLRSISFDDAQYKNHYGGSPLERDGAYHQGTVWSWLLGIYIDSIMKSGESNARKEARQIIEQLQPHLAESGIGTISEIFDGDAPHTARGCIAQAWSVAELIRVINEYQLVNAPKSKSKKVNSSMMKDKTKKKKSRKSA